MSNRTEAIVVGAGISGLVAARTIARAGYAVRVLEAQDRVGGRTLSEVLEGGERIDMGAMWTAPWQTRIGDLAKSLGIRMFPTFNVGRNVALWGDRRYEYRGTIPHIDPLSLVDIGQAKFRLERMARSLDLRRPWFHPRASEWDSVTFDSWIRRNVATKKGRGFFHIFAVGIFATEARHLSLLHVMFYINSSKGIDSLINVDGGCQQNRITGGSQLISQRLAKELGSTVLLNEPVRIIEQCDNSIRVHTDSCSFVAERVIVAVPPTLAGRILYNPALPSRRDQLTQRLPAGCVTRCMPVYDRPFWRMQGFTGQAASDIGPVKLVFDCSPEEGRPGVLLAFLLGEDARTLGVAPASERRRAVLSALARYFGPAVRNPVAYYEKDWAEDPWARGGYGAHFPPGVWTAYGKALREPIGRVHWAGAELAFVSMGQMDGAVESGERAATEVIAELRMRSSQSRTRFARGSDRAEAEHGYSDAAH